MSVSNIQRKLGFWENIHAAVSGSILPDTVCKATNASDSLGFVRALVAIWGMVEI